MEKLWLQSPSLLTAAIRIAAVTLASLKADVA